MNEIVEVILRFLAGIFRALLEAVLEAALHIFWEMAPRKGESRGQWWRRKSRWQQVRSLTLIAFVLILVAAALAAMVVFGARQLGLPLEL